MAAHRRLLGVAIFAALLFALWMAFMPHSPAGLRALAEEAGPFAAVAFLGVWAVATPSLISGTLLAAAGGLLFGPLDGSLITIAGATLGAAVAFGIARRFGGSDLGRLRGRAGRLVTKIEARGFRSILCLRAAPGVPATLVNYAAGASRVRLRDFVLASAIGGAPRGIAYAVLGSNATDPSALAVAAPVVVLAAMGVLGTVLAGATFRSPRPAAANV